MASTRVMLSVVLAGFGVVGCAGAKPAAQAAKSTSARANVEPKASEAPAELASALAPKAGNETNELDKVEADDRADMARQAAALERSIALYREFVARAGSDPMYAEAVKRSHERIQDAAKILDFLRQRPVE